MNRARGLTLLEVLAATVLLTILACTCVPIFAQAMRHCHDSSSPALSNDLVRAADQISAGDGAAGVNGGEAAVIEVLKLSPSGMNQDAAIPVSVCKAESKQNNSDHQWLIFQYQGQRICRWAPLSAAGGPETSPSAPPRGGQR